MVTGVKTVGWVNNQSGQSTTRDQQLPCTVDNQRSAASLDSRQPEINSFHGQSTARDQQLPWTVNNQRSAASMDSRQPEISSFHGQSTARDQQLPWTVNNQRSAASMDSQQPEISSFHVRPHSSGFGCLTSQSCDEGRTNTKDEQTRRTNKHEGRTNTLRLEYRHFTRRWTLLQQCVPFLIDSWQQRDVCSLRLRSLCSHVKVYGHAHFERV